MEKTEESISGGDSSRPWQSYNTVYTTAKAGMEGVDKEKVQRVVYEMSKGSKYFENEERKEAYMKQKTESMRAQLANLTASDISRHQKIVDKRIVELEATRDLSRIWLHVDMDAFYAAVETLSNPSLKGKPMAVGGMSMISTANYEARKFGVRAAMPGFIARKLCPELIFVPVDIKKYAYYSDLTRKVFQEYDPNFLAASLDEAYLDITSFCSDKGITAGEVADELRENVYKETGLTCSAGIGPNRLLAKVCSDINKPNGQFVLPNERMAVVTFISTLPIRKIGGIGKVTESILNGVLGITTCEELLQKSSFICALFSRSSADFFLSVGLGLGGTDTPQVTQRKSMSTERTFSPTEDEASLYQKLVELSENLSSDLKQHDLRGKTVTLKLKTSSFEVRTRAVTLPNYICSGEDILKHATKLLKAELPVSLRLMGLRMSHFGGGDPKQTTLSKFIVTENSSGREHEEEDGALSESNLTDDYLASNTNDHCESIDFVDTHQATDLDHNEENVDNRGGTTNTNMFPDGGFQSEKGKSVLRVSGESSSMSRWKGYSDEQRNDNEGVIWLHDYECSVCGIEMPPSFVEERREHSDFHLAERLQEEESSRTIQPKQRCIGGRKKKQKASPSEGKHAKIDMFFAKTSQDF